MWWSKIWWLVILANLASANQGSSNLRARDALRVSNETISWTEYDIYFGSHYQGEHPLSNYRIDIYHSSQPHFSNTPAWPVQAFPERLICELVWFTAHDARDHIYPIEDQLRIAYAEFQEGMCLLNVHGRIANATTLVSFLERYRAGLIVNQLIFDGKIRTASGAFPQVIYSDGDAFPVNKRLGVHDLKVRYEKGVRHQITAEGEACKINDKIKCPPDDSFPRTTDDIAFSLALEVYCASEWASNSGVWVFMPSYTVQTILGSVILAATAQVHHHFDAGDQGYTNYVLQELFDMSRDDLTAVCGQNEYYPEYWQKAVSVEQSQFMFTRKLNITKALEHPVLAPAVKLFLGQRGERLTETSPRYVAWVAGRWINAAGCPWYMFDATRAQLAYHPGDFIVHFNSCNHAGWSSHVFRDEVYKHGQEVFPVFNDDRDWDRWLGGSAAFQWVVLPKDEVVHGTLPPNPSQKK